ncbi:MAG: T9SS type A sorting domain-containing protein [Candidatus Marinimicrobia bacterium]|nr:T9SS type A sorting domain-containing protein [Candidatus Neomarinimicrobiota bacterium]
MKRKILLILGITTGLFATIINVPTDSSSIQGGINGAIDGDTVLVQPGTYFENINFNGQNVIVMSENGADSCTIESAAGVFENGTVVIFENGENHTAELKGFTISGGNAESMGGGILCENSSPVLKDLKIINNHSGYSAAWDGIGVGGGIALINSDAYVYDSIISSNLTSGGWGHNGSGGGIYCSNSSPTFSTVLIADNHSGTGGGLMSNSSTIIMLNCTTIDNDASKINSEVGNGIQLNNSVLTVINSIIWGSDSLQDIVSLDSSIISMSYTNFHHGMDGSGNISDDPLFVDPDNGDYCLQQGSPGIDAAASLFIWEGDTMVNIPDSLYNGNAPDMGAYESPYTVGAVNDLDVLPDKYALNQNYPNPFNPTTAFSYTLPELASIKLTVFDIRGQEVIILSESDKPPGKYEVHWNGKDHNRIQVSTGVYFCRLQTGSFNQTIKMVFLR